MREEYNINELNPRKNPYIKDKSDEEEMCDEHDFSNAKKSPYINNLFSKDDISNLE